MPPPTLANPATGLPRPPSFFFLLGGQDLEMVNIRELLEQHRAGFCDHGLAWGAKVSAYRPEVEAALGSGQVPVLVELENDLPDLLRPCIYALHPDAATAPDGARGWNCLLVDHHATLAGAGCPSSLRQVFALLRLPAKSWTRHLDLVEANDRGHLRGMRQLKPPATHEEMLAIRAADRAAQRVTPEDEAAARAAVAARETRAAGRLTLLRLASRKTSPAADFMEPDLGGPGFDNLLIVSPGELNFFGAGELVVALREAFPGGWSGGALPERGFWGSTSAEAQTVAAWLEGRLTKGNPPGDAAARGSENPKLRGHGFGQF